MARKFNLMTGKWDEVGGSGTSAPVDATFLTVTFNATLTNERVFTAGNGIVITDNGANSTFVVAVSDLYDPLLTMGG